LSWSPYGQVIAMTDPGVACGWTDPVSIYFTAPRTGTGAAIPAPMRTTGCPKLLGWRSATQILVRQLLGGHRSAIVQYSTVDGSRTVLSEFSTRGCGMFATCFVQSAQLATGLIGDIGLRDADSYPFPAAAVVAAVSPVAIACAALVLFLLARRRRVQLSAAQVGTVRGLVVGSAPLLAVSIYASLITAGLLDYYPPFFVIELLVLWYAGAAYVVGRGFVKPGDREKRARSAGRLIGLGAAIAATVAWYGLLSPFSPML
jgi:hypothetical protein